MQWHIGTTYQSPPTPRPSPLLAVDRGSRVEPAAADAKDGIWEGIFDQLSR